MRVKLFNIEKENAVTKEKIDKAIQCLVDNGIEEDEAETVLQALGYILLDEELFPEENSLSENDFQENEIRENDVIRLKESLKKEKEKNNRLMNLVENALYELKEGAEEEYRDQILDLIGTDESELKELGFKIVI